MKLHRQGVPRAAARSLKQWPVRAYTTILGVREHLYATASAVTFLIVAFYVPLLWMSVALMAWELYSGRREPLTSVVPEGAPNAWKPAVGE